MTTPSLLSPALADPGQPVPAARALGVARIAIGLVQGLILYVLSEQLQDRTRLTMHGMLLHSLLLMGLFIPTMVISGLSHMRVRKLGLWVLLLALLIPALMVHDIWRTDLSAWLLEPALGAWRDSARYVSHPSPQLMLLLPLGLFIAQAMVLAGSHDRRWVAGYPSYFAWAWKLSLQVIFAALFIAALWLILFTGAALFELLKIHFLGNLIGRSWFFIPVTTLACAAAMHLTDVKPAIIANMRKLLLTMLSWLLPLAVLIVAGFLVSLCSNGLQPLWVTGHATAVLLGTAALMVVLINMVYQDGLSTEAPPERLIVWSLRAACALLLPLVALAVYALGLRVSQYGWTPERLYGALGIAVASIYAAGYAIALRRAERLAGLAPVNVSASFAILAVSLATLSPLADPARIAVADQLARVRSGQIAPEQMDLPFMRDDGQRYGVRALAEITQSSDPQLASLREKSQLALQSKNGWQIGAADEERKREVGSNVRMHPAGRELPLEISLKYWPSYVRHDAVPECLRSGASECDGYFIRPPGARRDQLLIIDMYSKPMLLAQDAEDDWEILGTFPIDSSCLPLLRDILEGKGLQWKASSQYELRLGQVAVPLVPSKPGEATCEQ